MNCNYDTDRVPNEKQKTIVIADDDADIVGLLTTRCNELGCTVIGVSNAIDALKAINRRKPDLACLDVNMPAGNGLCVCEMMAGHEHLREIPTIILTGRSDATTIRRCHDMMAYYVQKNADIWSRVKPLVCELLEIDSSPLTTPSQNAREPKMETTAIAASSEKEILMDAVFEMLGDSPDLIGPRNDRHDTDPESQSEGGDDTPWVLCVDDDADFSEALACRLEAHGVAVVRAFNGLEGYRLAFTHPASAILLDYNMPNGQGDYVLCRLKDNPVTKDIPVIVVTGNKDRRLEQRMRAFGASGFLTKPLRFDLLQQTLTQHIDILETPVELTQAPDVRCFPSAIAATSAVRQTTI